MEIIDKQYIKIKCLTANQPIGLMYIGVIDSEDLEKITYADVRRLATDSENREVEDYIGIQRKLDTKRAEKEIGKYINLVDATFPNSIILSISSQHVRFIEETKELEIEYKDDIAKVLDGQHRIAGFEYYRNKRGTFELIVTIYVDMELEDQAIVFATINKEQKGVGNSLVADLYAFAESRSPQKTGHNIARALNAKEGSPFYKKIKILGAANNISETITQATFVESLLKYVSKDPHTHYPVVNPVPTGGIFRTFRGKIAIDAIREVEKGATMWSGLRPALARKGIVVKYNKYDEIYFSPDTNDTFIQALLDIKGDILVIENLKH